MGNLVRRGTVKQEQFLEVLDRDEAERRWHAVIQPQSLPRERVGLEVALGRVLAEDVQADVDVPGFDRSNMDGFAIRAEDSFGASEEKPIRLVLLEETIPTGVLPKSEVGPGQEWHRGKGKLCNIFFGGGTCGSPRHGDPSG